MNYYEKYIKYKKKYIELKQNYKKGGTLRLRRDSPYNNYIGTCWYQIILSMFSFSDKTKNKFMEFIPEKDDEIYENIFSKTLHNPVVSLQIYYLMRESPKFNKLEKRILENKDLFESIYLHHVNELLRILINRVKNLSTKKLSNIDFLCEEQIVINFNRLFKDANDFSTGGDNRDRYFMVNLLSIIIFNRRTNNILVLPDAIRNSLTNKLNDPNTYGIGFIIKKHIFCVFQNEGEYYYSNNTTLIKLEIIILDMNTKQETNDLSVLFRKIDENMNKSHSEIKNIFLHLYENKIILCITNESFYNIPTITPKITPKIIKPIPINVSESKKNTPVWGAKKPEWFIKDIKSAEERDIKIKNKERYNNFCDIDKLDQNNIISSIEFYTFEDF